jgi:hypothetical protein
MRPAEWRSPQEKMDPGRYQPKRAIPQITAIKDGDLCRAIDPAELLYRHRPARDRPEAAVQVAQTFVPRDRPP